MRVCVIFNPTTQGEKAKRFRRHLDLIAADCPLKQTPAAGVALNVTRDLALGVPLLAFAV